MPNLLYVRNFTLRAEFFIVRETLARGIFTLCAEFYFACGIYFVCGIFICCAEFFIVRETLVHGIFWCGKCAGFFLKIAYKMYNKITTGAADMLVQLCLSKWGKISETFYIAP